MIFISLKRELNMLKSEGTKITTKEEEEEENATIQWVLTILKSYKYKFNSFSVKFCGINRHRETVKAAHENEQDAKENFMEFEK